MDEANLGLIAAGMGFFGMLALFPGLAALIAIWGLVSDPAVIRSQLSTLEGVLPVDIYRLLVGQVGALLSARPAALGWATAMSLVAALWSTRLGVAALIRGVNAAYGCPNGSGLQRQVSILILTFVLIGVVIVALISVVVMPVILSFLPRGTMVNDVLELARWLAALTVMTLGLGLVYRYGPNRKTRRKPWLTSGGVLAVTIWAAASSGFSIYLTNFGRYNEVYGSIGAAVALLTWFYLGAYVVLLGAALNAALEAGDERKKTSRQSK